MARKPRGATAIRQNTDRSKHWFLLVGLAVGGLAIGIGLFSSGDPEEEAQSANAEPVIEAGAAPVPPPEPISEPEPQEPSWAVQTVGKGDNLSLVFKRAGYNTRDVYRFVNKAPEGESLGQ